MPMSNAEILAVSIIEAYVSALNEVSRFVQEEYNPYRDMMNDYIKSGKGIPTNINHSVPPERADFLNKAAAGWYDSDANQKLPTLIARVVQNYSNGDIVGMDGILHDINTAYLNEVVRKAEYYVGKKMTRSLRQVHVEPPGLEKRMVFLRGVGLDSSLKREGRLLPNLLAMRNHFIMELGLEL